MDKPIEVATSDGGTLEIPRDKVYVANVSPGDVSVHFTKSLIDMVNYDRDNRLGLWRGNLWAQSSANVSKARNDLARQFLTKTSGDWLLMVDSDMVFPPETIVRLLACAKVTGAKMVGGLCVGVGELGPLPTLFQYRLADAITGVQYDYPDDAQLQVAATGCACLMVHREVLEAWQAKARADRAWLLEQRDAEDETVVELMGRDLVRDPSEEFGWFQERVRLKRLPGKINEHWMSEDVDFCLRMGSLGYGIYVDCTLEIGHAKHGRIWYARDIRDGTGMPKPRIAAVIPVKDRLKLTRDLVDQLRQQGDCAEIIVCDNGSGKETRNWLSSQDDLTVFDCPDAGIHEMWNRGIDHALDRHGPRTRIAFLNNDLRLGPAFLRTLSQALDNDRGLNAVCGNYDGRSGLDHVLYTTDICANRYDGTGGFAGFAFMVKGEWFGSGYRFPTECKWWFGDNDLIQMITRADAHRGMDDRPSKAGIALAANVEHIDGGAQTAGDPAWSKFREQTEADRVAFETRWAKITDIDTREPVG